MCGNGIGCGNRASCGPFQSIVVRVPSALAATADSRASDSVVPRFGIGAVAAFSVTAPSHASNSRTGRGRKARPGSCVLGHRSPRQPYRLRRDRPRPGVSRAVAATEPTKHVMGHAVVAATLIVALSLMRIIIKESVVKVRNSLESLTRLPGAQVVRRRGRTFVINKLNPRGKGRQG